MLILTRKPGESVIIEDSVRITVLEVRGSQVKLGIQAPPEVRVNREEVLERQRADEGLPPLDPPIEALRSSRSGRRPAGENSPSGDPPRASHSSRGDFRRADSRRSSPAVRPPRASRPAGQHTQGSIRPHASPLPSSTNHPSTNHPSPRRHGSPSSPPPGSRRPGPVLHSHAIEPEELEPLPDVMRRYRLPEGRRFGRRWPAVRPPAPSEPESYPPEIEIEPLEERGIDERDIERGAESGRRSPDGDLRGERDPQAPQAPIRPRSKPEDDSEAA